MYVHFALTIFLFEIIITLPFVQQLGDLAITCVCVYE